MTKEAFIDSVEELYAMRDRVAKNAEYMIKDILREKGDMDYDYLYGEEESCVRIVRICERNEYLCGIYLVNDTPIVEIGQNFDRQTRKNLLRNLPLGDIIEIADYLCRM